LLNVSAELTVDATPDRIMLEFECNSHSVIVLLYSNLLLWVLRSFCNYT